MVVGLKSFVLHKPEDMIDRGLHHFVRLTPIISGLGKPEADEQALIHYLYFWGVALAKFVLFKLDTSPLIKGRRFSFMQAMAMG